MMIVGGDDTMECPRCKNNDIKKLYMINGQYYCRNCVSFGRVNIHDTRNTKLMQYSRNQRIQYYLDFSLSKKQNEISQQLLANYQKHQNSLVLAVCGSGKTEIVYEVIAYALSKGHRVCFCVPRKELVKELYERITYAFKGITIGVLYGGRQENSDAQFIVCTMHQLYRFENKIGFQLMIADEVDAFPFYGNEVLQQIFNRVCLGNYIKLSATFNSEDVKDEQLLIMNRRYHDVDLPVPRCLIVPSSLQKILALQLIKRMHKKCIVFVPCIADVDNLVRYFKAHHIKAKGVSSIHENNQFVIQEFKQNKIDIVVSTTILEHGITIEDVQVIVLSGEHSLFDSRTLIQIAGRVGRKPDHPTGYIYILSAVKTKSITSCINKIKELNTMNV
ncbi:MAG: DEAD/DEAH box helicase [Erysipelotrichaceae bacterium]|nr:DEAD/DEAH box helicase [Erysipelotrichaceae bacterium]